MCKGTTTHVQQQPPADPNITAPACRKLGQNQLSGSLPGEWAGNNAFQSLTELDVSSNRLDGDLPDSYGAQGAFSGLQLLRLGSNAFTGVQTVPACAAGMMSLHHHHCLGSCSGLHCCRRGFGFSYSFSCADLMVVHCTPFRRAGGLPPTWGNGGGFGALQNLLVEGNQLTGSLPATWGSAGRFGALSRLDVSGNQLQGSIPTAWGGSALPSLTAL